jgi:hypothetical protein
MLAGRYTTGQAIPGWDGKADMRGNGGRPLLLNETEEKESRPCPRAAAPS